MKPLELLGKRFGKLLVVKRLPNDKRGTTKWECLCDCGTSRSAYGTELNRGVLNGCNRVCNEKCGSKSPLFKGCGDIHAHMWKNIKAGAKNRGWAITVSLEQLWELFIKQNSKCALSGIPIKFAKTTRGYGNGETTASLDRIDSTKGYSIDNVQWVHKDINLMKQSMSQKEFIQSCTRVFEHSAAVDYCGTFHVGLTELNYDDIYLYPCRSIVNSRSECNTSVVLGNHSFAMPVYPSNMKSIVDSNTCRFMAEHGWFYTMHRFNVDMNKFVSSMQKDGLIASISIGVKSESYKDLEKLKYDNLYPEYITLDVANAWSDVGQRMCKYIKENFPTSFLIVGNVATGEACEELKLWGADAIKVGIAAGHVCITKNKTGFHRPMISTIRECVSAINIPVIADGGITTHGDIAKAIACGAHMVMAGKLFSGYDESAGSVIEISDKQYKEYYGSASEFNKIEAKNIEGKRVLVDYKGSMIKLLDELKEDLQSSISYAGGKNLEQLHRAKMLQITKN